MAPTIRRRTAPASATTSTSPTSSPPTPRPWRTSAPGGKNLVANCGYGRGYSVLEVIDTVKRVSGRDFKVVIGDRRPGDPAAIVADPALIMAEFGWKPRHDNLDEIVRSALAWEAALERRNQRD